MDNTVVFILSSGVILFGDKSEFAFLGSVTSVTPLFYPPPNESNIRKG